MRAFAASVMMLAATPALATGEIVCAGQGASVDLLVGHVPFLYIDRAIVSVGEKYWSSQPNLMPGIEISVGQGFEDDRQLLVDLTDHTMGGVIIQLRVFKASDGDKHASGGVLTVKGVGVFVVDCSEGE